MVKKKESGFGATPARTGRRWLGRGPTRKRTGSLLAILGLLLAGSAIAAEVNWPEFMAHHRMAWDSMPRNWTQASHFGNGLIGSMLYEGDGALHLQVFHAGVHDHRDNSHGWTAYSRTKYNIGDFYLKPVGRITGCEFTKDIWDAELTGTVITDAGRIHIRRFVHHEDMVIVTKVVPSEGETG